MTRHFPRYFAKRSIGRMTKSSQLAIGTCACAKPLFVARVGRFLVLFCRYRQINENGLCVQCSNFPHRLRCSVGGSWHR
jgi:hypothetical protein